MYSNEKQVFWTELKCTLINISVNIISMNQRFIENYIQFVETLYSCNILFIYITFSKIDTERSIQPIVELTDYYLIEPSISLTFTFN